MAVFETSRALTAGVNANGRGFFASLVAHVVDWNDRRMTRKALSALTSRELADIGLSRSDIADM